MDQIVLVIGYYDIATEVFDGRSPWSNIIKTTVDYMGIA